MFEDYWSEQIKLEQEKRKLNSKRYEIPHVPEVITVDQYISNLNKYTDEEVSNYVDTSWDIILNNIKRNTDKYNAINYFTDARLIKFFTNTLSKMPINLYIKYLYLLNHLCYINIASGNDTLYKISLDLSNIINRNIISKLEKYTNLNNTDINKLIIARYKSPENDINESIINVISVNKCIQVMNLSVEQIISVYNIIYDSMSYLFDGIMHDISYSAADTELYNKTTKAMLDYLEQQTYEVIAGVLINYSIDHFTYYYLYPVRFPISSIEPSVYPRIINAYNTLIQSQHVIFPY